MRAGKARGSTSRNLFQNRKGYGNNRWSYNCLNFLGNPTKLKKLWPVLGNEAGRPHEIHQKLKKCKVHILFGNIKNPCALKLWKMLPLYKWRESHLSPLMFNLDKKEIVRLLASFFPNLPFSDVSNFTAYCAANHMCDGTITNVEILVLYLVHLRTSPTRGAFQGVICLIMFLNNSAKNCGDWC